MTTSVCNISRRERWKRYWRGIRLLNRYIPRLFLLITLDTLCLTALPYSTVWFLARIINAVQSGTELPALQSLIVAAVLTQATLALLGGAFRRAKEARWEHVYRGTDRLLTDKLLSMDHAQLTDPKTQALLATVRETKDALGRGLVQIPEIYQNLLCGVIGVIGAIALSVPCFVHTVPADAGAFTCLNSPLWAIGAVGVLAVVIALSTQLSVTARRLEDADTDDVVAIDRMYYTFFNTAFDTSKAADMRLYRMDTRILHHLDTAYRAFFEKCGIKRRRLGATAICRALSAAVCAIWCGLAYGFIVVKLIGGAFRFGDAVQYAAALTMLFAHVGTLLQASDQMRQNTVHLDTVYAFLDIPHQLYRGSLTTEKRSDGEYELTFRHVSFCYPGQTAYALRDINVTLTKGSRTALVGEHGSGKSTFVKLLCRLYDPDEGEILLNGIDIRKYRTEEYIALISAVFRDACLLDAPLAHNIAGTHTYDRDRVEDALRGAGMASLDEAEDGAFVSPNDTQKPAIARALYKNAPFLALDEPTAFSDPVAEAAMYENLDRLIGDRTAIFISHRLSSCRFCDEILVLEKGEVVERGTHEALLENPSGTYSALWNTQAQYYK